MLKFQQRIQNIYVTFYYDTYSATMKQWQHKKLMLDKCSFKWVITVSKITEIHTIQVVS
jgi:hypothetical protein